MVQVWAMKLTESINICCTSDRSVCTVKVNIKERFMMNSCKFLYGQWTAARE